MDLVPAIVGILASYLLGALPNGVLIARAHGVDIQTVGSGNTGATNVFRSVGKRAGITVFLLDALKGWIPAFLFPLGLLAWTGAEGSRHTLGVAFGVAAIVGHNWPIYLKFKGGKGVATSAGVLIGVAYLAALIGAAVWAVLTVSTGYASVGSIGAAVAVAISGWVLYGGEGWLVPTTLTLLGMLVIWRHRLNIVRLREGTEGRFRRPGEPPSEPGKPS